WVHKYNGKYYLSYSTGDTHNIVYAIGDSPYGPFTYKGVILDPVLGWTNHHSIVRENFLKYISTNTVVFAKIPALIYDRIDSFFEKA
ncbi:hypothetical protein SB717_36790, partial [Priestia sp. SIMBA_032]